MTRIPGMSAKAVSKTLMEAASTMKDAAKTYSRSRVLASDRKYTGSTQTKPRRGVEDHYTGRDRPAEMKAEDEHAVQHDYQHGKGYSNDASGWVRGEGPMRGGLYPKFDHSPARGKEPRGGNTRGGKCEATGADVHKSPFSAAHKTYERTVLNMRIK